MKKSYKALGIFFKTEKQILREKTKKEIKKLIKLMILMIHTEQH